MSTATPIQPASDPPAPLVPREWRLRLDPLLLLAAVGLVVCSCLAIRGATRDDIAGDPLYYVERQAAYAAVGLVLMYAVSRLDYSRLRELKYALYGVLIGSIVLVFGLAGATRGSKRWIETPFMNFQPSELGKVLLVLALSGFVVDRLRGAGSRETTARVMLLGLMPAMLVMAQPDLGTAIVYVVGTLAVLFVAGAPWRHFAALAALGAVAIALALVVAAGGGRRGAPALPGGPPDVVPAPVRRLGRGGLSAAAVQDRHRLGREDRPRRRGRHADRAELPARAPHRLHLRGRRRDLRVSPAPRSYSRSTRCSIWRGLHILTVSKNLYGALIAGGITMMLLFQVFVNVGMTVGIMPITGVPAPLLSFGGSSMLVTFLAIGLLQSVHAQARETAVGKGRATVFQ